MYWQQTTGIAGEGCIKYVHTSGDGPSYAGTDLNLLALYPDLVIYKTGNLYTKTRIS